MAEGIAGLAGVQARIGQIEARISSLGGEKKAAAGATFAAALDRAAGTVNAALPPSIPSGLPGGGLRGLPKPPGWVDPMPITSAPAPAASASSGVAQWEGLIQKYASQYDVPADLIRAVMKQESNGNPCAVSSAGASGLMQLMPATARGAGVTDPFDPEQNVRAGVSLLRENLDRYKGNVALALAAYNAGPGNVSKYNGIPPFRETQNYVRKIMSGLGS